MFKNVASQKIAVFAFDATTGLGKAGDAANLTAYVSKDFGTVTALADTSATEMDATNAKGWYLFDLTQAETNGDFLLFTGKSSTTSISVVGQTIYTVPNRFSSLVIDAAGLVDATAVKVGPSGSGTAQTARDIGSSVLISSGTGTGQLSVAAGVIAANVTQFGGTAGTFASGVPDVNTVRFAGQVITAAAGVTLPASVASPTNITAGTITTVTNLTNAATAGDFTAAMKTSIGTAVAASAVASVTGNVGGNVTGSVGSVLGAVGSVTGNVGGSVASVVGLTASNLDAAISSRASAANLATVAGYIDTEVPAIQAVTDRLNTALELDGSVYRFTANALEQAPTGGTAPTASAIADEVQTRTIAAVTVVNGLGANTVTASALATDAVTEIQNGLATAAALSTVASYIDTEVAAIKAKTDNLPASPAATGDIPTAVQNADALLNRDMSTGTDSGSTTVRTVRQALRALRNKFTTAGGTYSVYKEDDTTLAWSSALTTDGTAQPITGSDPAG